MPIAEIQELKKKYPKFKDIPDSIMLQKIVEKYPKFTPIAEREFGALKTLTPEKEAVSRPIPPKEETKWEKSYDKRYGIKTDVIGKLVNEHPLALPIMASGVGGATFYAVSTLLQKIPSLARSETMKKLARGGPFEEELDEAQEELWKSNPRMGYQLADMRKRGAVGGIFVSSLMEEVGKFVIAAKAGNIAEVKTPQLVEQFTKDVVKGYNLPKKVYVSPKKVWDILRREETLKVASEYETDLVRQLNLKGSQYKDALKRGIDIEVPAEKIIQMVDRPWWRAVKDTFGINPKTSMVYRVSEGVAKATISKPTPKLLSDFSERMAGTEFGRVMQEQMKATGKAIEAVPLHPADAGRAAMVRIHEMLKPEPPVISKIEQTKAPTLQDIKQAKVPSKGGEKVTGDVMWRSGTPVISISEIDIGEGTFGAKYRETMVSNIGNDAYLQGKKIGNIIDAKHIKLKSGVETLAYKIKLNSGDERWISADIGVETRKPTPSKGGEIPSTELVGPKLSEPISPPPSIAPEAITPKVDNIKPIGIKSPEPSKPTRVELRKPHKNKMFQVEIQTLKGATITTMYEKDLVSLKDQIQQSYTTKIPARFNNIPVVKILDEFPINIKDVHLGVSPMPLVQKAKDLYNYIERVTDPVRTSPPDVARIIRQREIDQNVLIHNIHQVKGLMTRMVPDPKQQELITKYIEPGGEQYEDQMTPNMLIVSEVIMSGQEKMGMLAKRHGVIKEVLSEYMKHLVKDKELTLEEMDAKIRWAMSTNKISKFVESKHPRVQTEDGEIMFPTVESLEAAGYKVMTKNAIDLYEFTMRSEGIATINAELASSLGKVPYIDPRNPTKKLFQVMKMKPGEKMPRDFRILRKGVFTMKLASPEAYPAISAVAEPAMGGKLMHQITGVSKQIKFLLPFYHAWNFWRNSVEARGLIMGTKLFFDGAKMLEDPTRVSQILKMGVNLFRINKMAGPLTDEFMGTTIGKVKGLHEKITDALFCGMGDSLTAGLSDLIEKQLTPSKDFTVAQKYEIISEITNTLSGNLDPSSMSRFVRDIGRIGLLARNWTISNIREGVGGLLGKMPPHWSSEQKRWGSRWYRHALLRAFSQLFAVANIVNWMVSKHSYGKGRFTWENEGKWERKIQPLIWVNKNTGKEYYITNFYGSMGDIIHWMTRPITTLEHKMMIPVREVIAQINNRDSFTGEKLARDSDNLVEGVGHRLVHAGETLLTPAGLQPQLGKYPIPVVPKTLRLFGLAIGSGVEDADMLKKIRDFNEKKKYRLLNIDKKIYKALAERDLEGAEKIASDQMRYQHPSSLRKLLKKFRNPVKHMYFGLGRKAAREFEETLSPKEKQELERILGK